MLKLHSVTFALVDFSLQQTILLSPTMALPKHGPLRFSVVTSLYFNSPFIPWTYLQAKRMQITIMQITIKRMQITIKNVRSSSEASVWCSLTFVSKHKPRRNKKHSKKFFT